MGRPLAEAVDWLRLQLEDGPVPVVVLKRTAKEAGFVWQEMKKARKALGVESIRTNRSWVWKLPRDPDAPINTITHQAEARALMKAADRTMTDAERKRKFLDAYRELHFIKAACQATGISRGTHIYWLNSDPDYAELFEYARQDVLDTLEAEAWRRGYEGVERIKY